MFGSALFRAIAALVLIGLVVNDQNLVHVVRRS